MDDVSILTKEIVKLAEAIHNNSLTSVLVATIIVLLMVFALYFIFELRSRTKSLETQTKDIHSLTSLVKNMDENMKETAIRQVNIDQARILISSELERSKNAILFFIGKTLQKNNLSDKEAVSEKVHLFVNKTYGANVSVLNKFDFEQRPLSSFLETTWREDVKNKIIDEFDKFEKEKEKGMDCNKIEAKYTALFDEFKMIINHKIDKII